MKKRQTQENLVTRLKHVIQHFKQILCASLLPYKPLVINARSPPFPTILGWENTEMPGATWVLTWLRFQTHPPCIGKRPDLSSTCWHFACPQAGGEIPPLPNKHDRKTTHNLQDTCFCWLSSFNLPLVDKPCITYKSSKSKSLGGSLIDPKSHEQLKGALQVSFFGGIRLIRSC